MTVPYSSFAADFSAEAKAGRKQMIATRTQAMSDIFDIKDDDFCVLRLVRLVRVAMIGYITVLYRDRFVER